MKATAKFSVALLASLALLSCSNSMNLEVTSTVPTAAMQASEKSINLVLVPEFTDYIYRENSDERQNWEVALGSSQSALFRGIFESAFGNVVISNLADVSDVELVFSPRLVEMQLATPYETGFKFYEAWLNYDIDMRSVDGTNAETIKVVAYGKENTSRFQRRQDGLHKALESALRDAGAKLTVALIGISHGR